MKKLYGIVKGLKANQIRRLENLYRRRIPPEFLITPELARDVCILSHEINRQTGLLINRQGKIEFVIVGTYQDITIPDTQEYRFSPGRLNGLRCIHTHLNNEELTRDDLTDLALLRFDIMSAITVKKDGEPNIIHISHILPGEHEGKPCQVMPPVRAHQLDIGFLELIQSLESELSFKKTSHDSLSGKDRALLVSVASGPKRSALASLDELNDLALSCGLEVVGTFLQHRHGSESKQFIGSGKIKDITIFALQKGSTIIVFDQELTPTQIRNIADQIDIKVIDRTQLILDIFAQRAQTREGKVQVELAQMKYLLPRLVTKNTAMSRLTGGIGGRGPGETKLEINRRRVRERIADLEKSLEQVRKNRSQQKALRNKKNLPVISIIGYTNAGKSSLLNTMTKSNVVTENRLFATLDPASRRLKFPKDLEVIITDTVGFIRDLPKDLQVAFRATLEELKRADLLLHVIDISNTRHKDQMESVYKILNELELTDIPCINVLNKMDTMEAQAVQMLKEQLNGIPISAIDERTLAPLIEKIQASITM